MTTIQGFLPHIQLVHICLSLVFVQLALLFVFRKRLNQQEQFIDSIKNEIHALLLCERGIADRLKQQQQQVRWMADRQDKLELTEAASGNYKQAMALMKRGASTDEVVDTCDLSRGELELISHLQNIRDVVYNNRTV